MNRTCPACGSVAISILRKMVSSEVFPARCRSCGEMVAARRTAVFSLLESVTCQVIVFGGAVVAFFMGSWWPLIAGILVDAAVMMLLYRHTPLTVVTSGQRFRWRVGAMIGVAVFIALVILAGVADRV